MVHLGVFARRAQALLARTPLQSRLHLLVELSKLLFCLSHHHPLRRARNTIFREGWKPSQCCQTSTMEDFWSFLKGKVSQDGWEADLDCGGNWRTAGIKKWFNDGSWIRRLYKAPWRWSRRICGKQLVSHLMQSFWVLDQNHDLPVYSSCWIEFHWLMSTSYNAACTNFVTGYFFSIRALYVKPLKQLGIYKITKLGQQAWLPPNLARQFVNMHPCTALADSLLWAVAHRGSFFFFFFFFFCKCEANPQVHFCFFLLFFLVNLRTKKNLWHVGSKLLFFFFSEIFDALFLGWVVSRLGRVASYFCRFANLFGY